VFAFLINNSIKNDKVWGDTLNATGADKTMDSVGNALSSLDVLFPFLVAMFGIGMLVSAFMVRSMPIFFVISFIFFTLTVPIVIIFSNVFYGIIDSGVIGTTPDNMPFTILTINIYPLIYIVFMAASAIVSYAQFRKGEDIVGG
jgi:hypothetical protein